MGGKKKTRSKQRKAKVDLAQEAARAQAAAAQRGEEVEVIYDRDDPPNLLPLHHADNPDEIRWLLERMHSMQPLTCEDVVQSMPRSIGVFLERKFQSQAVCAILFYTFEHAYGPTGECWTGAVEHDWLTLGLWLTIRAIGSFGRHGVVECPHVLHFWMTLVNFLEDATTKEFPSEEGESEIDLEAVTTTGICGAIDKACEAWAYFMDVVLCGSQQGRFLRECPIYGLTHEAFMELVDKTMNREPEKSEYYCRWYKQLLHLRLRMAVAPIFDGSYSIDRECWKCRVIHPNGSGLYVCSKCKVACYDSKDCQIAAWKKQGGDHKHHCQHICDRHTALQESIRTIERVHAAPAEGSSHDNGNLDLYPDAVFVKASDYYLLFFLHGAKQLQEESAFFERLQGPSMHIFYANLARIQMGDFWILKDAVDVPLSEEEEEEEDDDDNDDGETDRSVLTQLFHLLSYDFLDFCEQRHSVSDPAEIWKIVGREYPITGPFFQDLARRVARGRVSAKIMESSEPFLLYYQILAREMVLGVPVDGPEWEERRSLLIRKALKGIYDKYHG